MKRGDLVAVAFDGYGEVIGYGWETPSATWIREVRATLLFTPGELVGFDCQGGAEKVYNIC
jgi:hypothetical protein